MSSSTPKIFLCFRGFIVLAIFFSNAPLAQGQQIYCGDKLTNVLDLLCQGAFVRKIRKPIDPNDYYMDDPDDLPSPFEQLPFFSNVPASVIAKTRRRRYGIVNECCKKPCRTSEILPYCTRS